MSAPCRLCANYVWVAHLSYRLQCDLRQPGGSRNGASPSLPVPVSLAGGYVPRPSLPGGAMCHTAQLLDFLLQLLQLVTRQLGPCLEHYRSPLGTRKSPRRPSGPSPKASFASLSPHIHAATAGRLGKKTSKVPVQC